MMLKSHIDRVEDGIGIQNAFNLFRKGCSGEKAFYVA